jgi:hypothetical protein
MFRLSTPGMLIREEPIKDSESLPLRKWTRENSTTPCCSILTIIMAATPKGMDVAGCHIGYLPRRVVNASQNRDGENGC